jgi:phosphopantetheine--protein transferase-like protein
MHPALEIIAHLGRTEPSMLRPEQTLSSLKLSKSLGLNVLRSALERKFQRKPLLFGPSTTIGEVLAQIDPGSATAAETNILPLAARNPARWNRPAMIPSVKPASIDNMTFGHGIDIQEIASLPDPPAVPEADPFFNDHFAATELAAVKTRPDARAHLTGLWCAKEAIRKSHPDLLQTASHEIIISHDSNGRPIVHFSNADIQHRFEVTLSISHSAAYAIASAIIRTRR